MKFDAHMIWRFYLVALHIAHVINVHSHCTSIYGSDILYSNYASVRMLCLSVCVCRVLQLLKGKRSASKSFYRLLVMFSWILTRGFAK